MKLNQPILRKAARFTLALLLLVPVCAQTPLPDGDGKKLVERICNQCHGPENYARKKHSQDEWEKIVDDMVEKGATGTDDEFETVVRYLAKNFGKTADKTYMYRTAAVR